MRVAVLIGEHFLEQCPAPLIRFGQALEVIAEMCTYLVFSRGHKPEAQPIAS